MAKNNFVVDALKSQITRLQLDHDNTAASLAAVKEQETRLQETYDQQAQTIAELNAAVEQMEGAA